ncbi:pilus assembly protein TadG-related protein [Methylocapsa sp. S129]|uniref:pilus assembly protein TadG-related protein n=1 Tax=Methylocapsa sp. S129 TaxID=1641869 RepID=UPI00131CB41D|nr:pilus assembly protein TadG-related protein [Methylocapsa sp. S129]
MITEGFFTRLVKFLGRRAGAARRDRRGNVAITFALMAIPLIVMMGVGLDFYRKLSYKARLDAAADAAAIAAINTTQAFLTAPGQTLTGSALTNAAYAAGQAQGVNVFKANVGAVATDLTLASPQVTVALSPSDSLVINATVTYSAQAPTVVGGLVGISTLQIAGQSQSSLSQGAYENFYLMLDVSGSMGLPTASADQDTLKANNPDDYVNSGISEVQGNYVAYPNNTCAFACHFNAASGDGNYAMRSFAYAESHGLKLRVDSLASAVLNLINYANTPGLATKPNQYQLGIYPFINHAVPAVPLAAMPQSGSAAVNMFTPVTTTSAFINTLVPTGSTIPANTTTRSTTPLTITTTTTYTTTTSPFASTYLDNGAGSVPDINGKMLSIGSGGTHFENLWGDMKLPNITGAPGTAASPQGYIFIVTDGADNAQTYPNFTGSQPQLPNANGVVGAAAASGPYAQPSFCSQAKAYGYTVAVLLIPYVPITPASTSFGSESINVDDIATPTTLTPTGVSPIEQTMTNCASPGFFAKADSDADISAAIVQLFQQSVASARLTQ